MALATLLAITIACIGWSLWIRRVTWTCRWEVAATLNIALQGLAVLLMSPLASETVGHWLHALTGKPILVTEFYLAGQDNRSGNKNTEGIYQQRTEMKKQADRRSRDDTDLARAAPATPRTRRRS